MNLPIIIQNFIAHRNKPDGGWSWSVLCVMSEPFYSQIMSQCLRNGGRDIGCFSWAQVRSVSFTVFAVLYVMLWLCCNAASLYSCVYQLYVAMVTFNRQLSAVGHQCWQRQWQGWQNGGRVFIDLPSVHNLVRKLQRVCAFYICGEGRFYLYNRRFLHMFKYNHIYR